MKYLVTEADTAVALGSGDVPVLATPRLLAWLEAATVAAAAPLLEVSQTTVGTGVRISHRRATGVGETVEVVAETPSRDGARGLRFTVRALDESGRLLADGEIDRAIVDRARFLAKL